MVVLCMSAQRIDHHMILLGIEPLKTCTKGTLISITINMTVQAHKLRHAPSGTNPEGEPVIGTTIHLDWSLIVRKSDLRNEGADNPRVAVYVHKRLKGLRPGYRRDLIDHRDILVFSLGWGEDLKLLANVYSDDQHTAIRLLYERTMDWPQLFFMGGDFNCRH